MASSSLRLRRTLRTLSGLHRSFSATAATSAPLFPVPVRHAVSSTLPSSQSLSLLLHSRAFRSSTISLLSARSSSFNDSDEIGPDTILFEGCDYNHWLFVMDFPKDNKPTPQQMIETYEQTCAKGLNISLEEAKKKIYACSTTIYTGFQAVMTEEESKKFEGLPGVIFVLPDSYIDPVNKEYGGDKYINGTIIPRPPPIQYGRSQGRRDRNRYPDQPRYNQQGNQMSHPPGNHPYNYQGSMQGDGRNFGPSQNYPPPQNYGPASQSYPQQQGYGPPSQQYPPQQQYGPASPHSPQQQYGPASPHSPQQQYGPPSPHAPQQQYGPASPHTPQQQYGPASPQAPQQHVSASQQHAPQPNYAPPGQVGRDPMPRHGGTAAYQGQRETFVPSYREEFEQGSQNRYPPSGQGWTGDNRNYGQGVGYQGTASTHGQGTNPGYGQNFSGQGEAERFAQEEQRNAHRH